MSPEKELMFFKEEATNISNDRKSVTDLIKDVGVIGWFNDLFHVKATNALAILSFTVGIFSVFIAAVFASTRPNFFVFLALLAGSVYSIGSLFKFMGKLNQKEYNILSRKKFTPFADDLDYVIDIFEHKYNIKTFTKFSNEYTASLELFTKIDGEIVNFYTISLFTLEGTTPDVWHRRMCWSYEDALDKVEAKKSSNMLSQIKTVNKDVWFSLCGKNDQREIKEAYKRIFG